MTETVTPSGQSWFHTHLIIHDLYWPLDGEIVILNKSTAIKITSDERFFVFVTLSCKDLHTQCYKRPAHPLRYFLLFLAAACSYMCIYCLKLFFSALNAPQLHIFCVSQINLARLFCICFTDVLPWGMYFYFIVNSKKHLFSSTSSKPTEPTL